VPNEKKIRTQQWVVKKNLRKKKIAPPPPPHISNGSSLTSLAYRKSSFVMIVNHGVLIL